MKPETPPQRLKQVKRQAGNTLPPLQSVVTLPPLQETQDAICWVYKGTEDGLSLETYQRPSAIEPGSVVVDITMSSICGSDLHTIHGRRKEPTPLILGHEIVGRIADLGDEEISDWHGEPLSIGDRVTWSIMACCGKCFYCNKGLPQKCEHLHKYGHCSCDSDQPLSGGFSECILLRPGTAIFKVPDYLPDEYVVPANCALATAFNAIETAGLRAGQTVLIQGAGLIGVYLAAICKEMGASKVIVVDVNPDRLRMAEQFRADLAVDQSRSTGEALSDLVNAYTHGRGVDLVVEACGSDSVIEPGARLLRKGGRYVIAGLVTPVSRFDIPADLLTKNCLSVMGVHNYRPEHLAQAMAFIDLHADSLPFDKIVGKVYPLSQLRDALEAANSGTHLRVAIKNGYSTRH